ncbi:GEVED domain-containing protein, partial [Acinetobacter sp.]|uniref:DUF6923 family protein n=1 Tax=Acinetobacter sp. TaxID=472 RepID=UPI0035B0310A
SGNVSNIATITAPSGTTDPVSTNNSATDTDSVSLPPVDLSITKTDGVTATYTGDEVTYTVVVTNNGPRAANGALFKDAVATGLTKTSVTCSATNSASCPTAANLTIANIESTNGLAIPTLPNGGVVTFTIKANVTATSGNVSNVATITAPSGTTDPVSTNNSATDTDSVSLPSVDMAIEKLQSLTNGSFASTALTVNRGSNIFYQIKVTNNGPRGIGGTSTGTASFTDSVPSNITALQVVTTGTTECPAPTISGQTVSGTFSGASGASCTYVIQGTASTTGSITNTASVSTTGVNDAVSTNNTSSVSLTISTPQTDLTITKTDNATTSYNDTDTTYTIVVSNAGSNAADGAIFKDPAVTGLTKNTISCTAAGGATCPTITDNATGIAAIESASGLAIPTLPSGGSVTFSIRARVTANSGSVSNTATIDVPSGVTDSNTANNTATDTNSVTPLTAFMCQPNIYMTQGNNSNTALYELTISGVNQVSRSPAIGSSYPTINALGYNPKDGYLYAIRLSDHSLVRIGDNGTQVNLGLVSGLPTVGVTQYVAGSFDDDGKFYVIANGAGRALQIIDVEQRTVIGTGGTTPKAIHGDIVINDDGYAYGISHLTSSDSTPVRIPLTGGMGTTIGPSIGLGLGAGYLDTNNGMYFSDNASNDIYRLDPTDGSLRRIAIAVPPEVMSQNDGAFCREAIFPVRPIDFGDAPDSYGSPSHTIVTGILLGSINTAEDEPYNSASASGDVGDDGVTLPSFVASQTAQVTVVATGSGGMLQAWVDWNGNGVFDSNEQIATNLADNSGLDTNPASGTIVFNVNVPATAVAGNTFARFSWSTVSNVSATSDLVVNGEVEDYQVTVVSQIVISGKVFEDNSGTTGIASNAYNAVQNTGEVGIANSTVQLTNCSGTVLATTETDAVGQYQFAVSQATLPSPNFCVVQTNVEGYTSVSGTTGYTRGTDTITVPKATSGNYTDLNFGDAKLNLILTENGQHTVVAGAVTDYPHRLQTDATVQVTGITQTLNQQPSSASDQDWQALIYRDSNCNGTVDAGEALFNPTTSTPATLLPSAAICLVQRVHVPTNVYAGAQHNAQLEASYSVTLSNPEDTLTGDSNTVQDTTLTGSAGLELSKKVRKVASCPSTAADTDVFSTINEATTLDKLEYEITYKNNSVKNLQNVKIKDAVPTGTTFGSISCQSTPSGNSCTPTRTGEALLWQLTGNLSPASSGTVRFCVTPQ